MYQSFKMLFYTYYINVYLPKYVVSHTVPVVFLRCTFCTFIQRHIQQKTPNTVMLRKDLVVICSHLTCVVTKSRTIIAISRVTNIFNSTVMIKSGTYNLPVQTAFCTTDRLFRHYPFLAHPDTGFCLSEVRVLPSLGLLQFQRYRGEKQLQTSF